MFLTGGANKDTLKGGAGTDTLYGFGGNDSLWGGGGDDVLAGHEGDDTLSGGAGDDYLLGGLGNDVIDGGVGMDWASYEDAIAAIRVSLALTGWQATGGAGSDKLTGIENLYGSAFNDTLIGNAGVNYLSGGAGDDSLSGGAGDDHLEGGAGNNYIDGGDGHDVVSFDDSLEGGVAVNLTLGFAGDYDTDTPRGSNVLVNIEDVYATNYNDFLVGDAGDNALIGRGGNDIIEGRGGNDLLDGGEGDDQFLVAANLAGHTTVLGGEGYDRLYFDNANFHPYPTPPEYGITLDLAKTGPQQVNPVLTMTVSSVEEIWGTSKNDTFYASTNREVFVALGGEDRFVYRSLAELGLGDTADDIAAWPGGVIDVSAIDADVTQAGDQAFRMLVMNSDFTGRAGEIAITYLPDREYFLVRFDVDGDKTADASLWVSGAGYPGPPTFVF